MGGIRPTHNALTTNRTTLKVAAVSDSEPRQRTVHFVSLGCPKNRVDTEVMLGVSDQQGLQLVEDPAGADVIVVNTCGFVEAARQESIDTILELSELKQAGLC